MKKWTVMLISCLMVIQFFVIESHAVSGQFPQYVKQEVTGSFANFIAEYQVLLSGVWGFFMASSVLVFIIHLIKLSQYSNMPLVRMKIMNDMLITGICTACLGSFGLVFYLITRLVL